MKKAAITIFLLILLTITSNSAFAVNFYDGAHAKNGHYFLSYTSLYIADETTNAKGNKSKDKFGLTKADEILRWCYYSGDFVATALAPVGYMSVDSLHQHSSGLGDVILGTGYFLPFRKSGQHRFQSV